MLKGPDTSKSMGNKFIMEHTRHQDSLLWDRNTLSS